MKRREEAGPGLMIEVKEETGVNPMRRREGLEVLPTRGRGGQEAPSRIGQGVDPTKERVGLARRSTGPEAAPMKGSKKRGPPAEAR